MRPRATTGATLDVSVRRAIGGFRLAAEFVAEPGITVLFGPSGSGKSMTLRCIAGLARPDGGRVAVDGEALFDSDRRVDIPAHRRRVGVLLQRNALFPHLSVRANVEFGIAELGREARQDRVRALLALLNLTGFEDRRPHSLSGGQQQRVALARALAPENRLLLLDEPFSALDESLRQDLREELLRLARDMNLTIIFVTHDLREAHLLADDVAVFDAGRVLQFGPAREVFRRPAVRRVAELTGVANVWRGKVIALTAGRCTVDIDGLRLLCDGEIAAGTAVDVAMRAERVVVRRRSAAPGVNAIAASIAQQYAYGSVHTVRFRPNGAGPIVEVELASRPYEVLDMANQLDFVLELPPGDLHLMVAPG
ncbi:MAG: ABC transporter ATP-binding protein [Anaerolineaceae bacterium]